MIEEQADGTPISPEGLSALLSGPGDAYVQATLEKHGFAWQSTEDITGDSALAEIDAVGADALDGYLTLIHHTGLVVTIQRWVDIGGELSGATSTSHDLTGDIPSIDLLAMTNEGTIWLVSGDDLYVSDDLLASSPTLIYTASAAIAHIGAIDDQIVHLVIEHSTEISRLVRVDRSGLDYESEVYWPFSVTSFDARALSSGDECVLLCGEYMPYTATTTAGTRVAYETYERTGVVSFIYKDGVYSDHYEVFVAEAEFDQEIHYATMFQAPNGIGVVFGSSSYALDANYYSISNSGMWWEVASDLSFLNTSPIHFLILGDYLYAYQDGTLWITGAGQRFGQSNSTRMIDVSNEILSGTVNSRVKAGVSLALEKTPEIEAFINKERMHLSLSVGYRLGGGHDLLVKVFTGPVNRASLGGQEKNTIEISATDTLHWLSRSVDSGRMQSSFMGGIDEYTNNTGQDTKYGGMDHTYPVMHSWSTPDGKLAPTQYTTGEVMANTTYISDQVNVDVRVMAGKVDPEHYSGDETENFGIAVRSVGGAIATKSVWYPDEDELKLIYMPGTYDSENNLNTEEMLSVSLTVDDQMYIRHVARYALHRIYKSDDGVTWTQVAELIDARGVIPGSAGVCGYNIGEEFDIPDFNWQLPWLPPFPIPVLSLDDAVVVAMPTISGSSIHICLNPRSTSPEWIDITYNASGFHVRTIEGLGNFLYLSTDEGVYYMNPLIVLGWLPFTVDGTSTKGAYLQKSPDRTKLLIPTWDTQGYRYAYVIDQEGAEVDYGYVGRQYPESVQFVSWWDDSHRYFAGHSNADGDFNIGYEHSLFMTDNDTSGSTTETIEDEEYLAESRLDDFNLVTFTVIHRDKVFLHLPNDVGDTDRYYYLKVDVELIQHWEWDADFDTSGLFGASISTVFKLKALANSPGISVWHPTEGRWTSYLESGYIQECDPWVARGDFPGDTSTFDIQTDPQIITTTLYYRFDGDYATASPGFFDCVELESIIYPEGATHADILAHCTDRYIESSVHLTSMGSTLDTDPDPISRWFLRVPHNMGNALHTLVYDICNSVTCDSSANCCGGTDFDLAPFKNCPDWFTGIVDRIPGGGVIHENATGDIAMAADPTPCEGLMAVSGADILLTPSSQGRNIIKLSSGAVWSINIDRDTLLYSPDSLDTIHSYALPGAISGDSYIGMDLLEGDPVVWGPGGVFLYDVSEGSWVEITGDLVLSAALSDGDGIHPKNITTFD